MLLNLDDTLYQLINHSYNAEWLDFAMKKFSDKTFWLPFYAVIIFFLTKEYGKKSIVIVLFLLAAVGVSDRLTSGVIKPLIKRERPCHVESLNPRVLVNCSDSGSMPSSHAANHFAIAIFMILLSAFKTKSSIVFWLLWAFLIGLSRIYNGVHYPSDVLVGAIIGSGLGFMFFKLHVLFLNKFFKK